MNKFLYLIDGWKTIIGYVLLQLPFLSSYPALKTSITESMSNPSKENITNLLVQLILLTGVIDRVKKNLTK